MRQPVLTIFFQFDPLYPTIGGIQTCIRYIIKYAPRELQLRIVGITSQPDMKLGVWHELTLFGREFLFMPILFIEDDNIRGLIPTTVKYTAALLKYQFSSDFLQFHRIEPTLVTRKWLGSKILYIHNDIYQEVKGGSKGGILWKRFPWLYFTIERQLVGQFDRIFSCNSDSVELYRQRYPEIASNVTFLRNTIDSDLFYPLSAEERDRARRELARSMNLPENTRFILFAGRLHPQKDPLLLLQSFAALQESNLHLLIVGKGELEDEVKSAIAELNISESVTLRGSLPQLELAHLYRVCQIFVLTSAYEGLARGSIEALACGTPVVTTRAGETPKFLSADAGIVCPERTVNAVSTALQRVLQHPEQYPSSACVRVAKPYDARVVVSELYGELLKQWTIRNPVSVGANV